MTQSRPSRTARWAVGLSLTLVLTLTTSAFGLAGFVAAQSNGSFGDGLGNDSLDGRTTAVVLDVDAYNYDDEPVPLTSDWRSDDGYATVDVDFTVGVDHEVTTMDWPDGRELPQPGDRLEIAYDSTDPEYAPLLAAELDADRSDTAHDGRRAPAWLGITTLVNGILAVLVFIGTVIWARRAPAVPAPAPYWNQAPLGWQPQPVQPQPVQPPLVQPPPLQPPTAGHPPPTHPPPSPPGPPDPPPPGRITPPN